MAAKSLSVLAGEADDDVGGEGDAGHRVAHARHEVAVGGARCSPPHALEHPVRSRLHRQVDVLQIVGCVGHGRERRGIEVRGMRAR